MFLGEIFQIQTQTINGLPNPIRATKKWPDPTTFFGPDPSLPSTLYIYYLSGPVPAWVK